MNLDQSFFSLSPRERAGKEKASIAFKFDCIFFRQQPVRKKVTNFPTATRQRVCRKVTNFPTATSRKLQMGLKKFPKQKYDT